VANGDPVAARLSQLADQRINSIAADYDPVSRRLQRIAAQRQGTSLNLADRALEGLRRLAAGETAAQRFVKGNLLIPEVAEGSSLIETASATGLSQFAGLVSPTLSAGAAILQFPGLFLERDIPTDRAADFLKRLSTDIRTDAEQAGLDAGLSPEAIADAYLYGELVGYTAPVVASLKTARLLTGIEGAVIGLARNFQLDTVAGGVYGALLTEGETAKERVVHSLEEMALFGVGGLMMNGLLFGLTGMRFSRLHAHEGSKNLDDMLTRIENGEQVIINREGSSLVHMMNEEGFLATSPEAQVLIQSAQIDEVMVAAVKGTQEAGQTRGFVRNIGEDLVALQNDIPRLGEAFPGLEFDLVARKIPRVEGEAGQRFTFDLHFGRTRLNVTQRNQLLRGERYTGQLVEKGGATYEYVRPAKKGGIIVKTADGRTVRILDTGITDLPKGIEEIPLPTAGQALYADFREFSFGRMGEAAGVGGSMSEEAIIKGLRDGTLILDDVARRDFPIAGAITHPEELGPSIEIVDSAFRVRGEIITVPKPSGQQGVQTHIAVARTLAQSEDRGSRKMGAVFEDILSGGVERAEVESGFIDKTGKFLTREEAFAVTERIEKNTGLSTDISIQDSRRVTTPGGLGTDLTTGKSSEFIEDFLQAGKLAGEILDPAPIRVMDDVFDAWVARRGLNASATDLEAFRQNFAQRYRDDIWALIPEEDMAIFRSIREESNALMDEIGLTLEQRAQVKGFHVEDIGAGRIALRDINTGGRLQFGSEKFASDFVDKIIRSEKDPFGLFDSPGPMGMPGLTGGFDPTDGVFTVTGNIQAKEFLTELPFAFSQNRRDLFVEIERLTGVPLFSKGFMLADEAITRKNKLLAPIGLKIQEIFKGLNRIQRIEVAEFWTSIEGTAIKGAELVKAARAKGLNTKQIRAFTEGRKLFDLGAQMLGLPESRYISNYYTRIRPMLEEGKTLDEIRRLFSDESGTLREFDFWAEYTRTGDLANIDMDPEIVMHKYFRSLLHKQEVAPVENEIRRMLNMRIKELPLANQKEVLARAQSNLVTKESLVLPQEVRSVLTEYMLNIRGDGSPGFGTARRFTTALFKQLGMETDERLFDQLHSLILTTQYGAAIGARIGIMNRNAVQNLWTMYPRVGGKHGTTSLREILTERGYNKWLDGGAIRPVEASVPQGDAVFGAYWGSEPLRGTGPVTNAIAAGARQLARVGKGMRALSRHSLVPYGSSDQINRAWAAEWQYLHTNEWLKKFNAREISWDKFLDEGLPFYSEPIKREFRNTFDKLGREEALLFIGRQAADEANFIYGAAASPTWMQRPFGRLVGVFGQWPLWSYELYARRMKHATAAQKGKFWVRTAGLIGAFANMSMQSGIDMWNWMAPASLEFAGGPFVDVLVDLKEVIGAPLDRRAAAIKRMAGTVGSLSFPGQIMFQELSRAVDTNDPRQAALMLTLGRPADQQGNFAYDFILDPAAFPVVEETSPSAQGLPSIEELIGRP